MDNRHSAGRMNKTDYIDPYTTRLDQNSKFERELLTYMYKSKPTFLCCCLGGFLKTTKVNTEQ